MANYLLSRLFLVFLCKFFIGWAINTKHQLIQFFDFKNGNFLDLLSYIFSIVIILLGILLVGILIILYVSVKDNILNYSNTFNIKLKSIFRLIFSFNLKERYPNLFIWLTIIYIFYSNGNPIINNYFGIYKEYESDELYISEQPYYIFKKGAESDQIRDLENNYNEEIDSYYEVKKRGYLFIQAGIIDGYKTYQKGYKGFNSYMSSLLYYAFEKLINTIIYFMIPFIICMSIYHYRLKRKGQIIN
jgi:hypothetical protein